MRDNVKIPNSECSACSNHETETSHFLSQISRWRKEFRHSEESDRAVFESRNAFPSTRRRIRQTDIRLTANICLGGVSTFGLGRETAKVELHHALNWL